MDTATAVAVDAAVDSTAPLVPRNLRFEVPERMSATGDVVKPVDEASLARIALRWLESVLGQDERVVQIHRRIPFATCRVVVDYLQQFPRRTGLEVGFVGDGDREELPRQPGGHRVECESP